MLWVPWHRHVGFPVVWTAQVQLGMSTATAKATEKCPESGVGSEATVYVSSSHCRVHTQSKISSCHAHPASLVSGRHKNTSILASNTRRSPRVQRSQQAGILHIRNPLRTIPKVETFEFSGCYFKLARIFWPVNEHTSHVSRKSVLLGMIMPFPPAGNSSSPAYHHNKKVSLR